MIRKTATAIFVLIAAVLLFTVCPLASFGQDLAELEVDHALTFQIQTPHIKWARPNARGTSRVLFFINGRGTNFREGVELMQRFDIEAEAVLYGRIVDTTTDDWHGGQEGVKRMDSLLQKHWDAFVFLGVAPEKMPLVLKKRLMAEVQAGSGLLLSGVDDGALLAATDETKDAVPFLAGIRGVKAFALGKGRGVRLPTRPVIEYAEGWQNLYETWQQDLGRAVLWATGESPQSEFSFALSSNVYAGTEPVKLHINWSGVAVGEKPVLQLWIRKPVGWVASWPDRKLTSGDGIDLMMPRLPAGRYHVDGRVVGSAGVENWATIPFEVTSPRMISGLELNPDWGEIDGKIAGSVTLTGPATPDEKIRIDVLDKNRRVLLRRALVANNDRADFSFDIPSWMPMLATIEATVMNHEVDLTTASRYFHVTHRNRNQFNFLIWDVPRGTLAPYAEESLARTGVTLQLAQGNPPLHVAANDIAWVPYTTHISAKSDTTKPFRWNDAAAVGKDVQTVSDQHQLARQHGVFAYSLGDEIDTRGACLTASCRNAYRDYLKEIYGALEALNRSWETNFAAWDEVTLAEAGDNVEARSLKNKNYPRWYDRQAFMSYNFVQYAQKYAGAYAGIDPRAKTGFEGAGRFAGGDDIDLIVRHLGFWSPYPGTTDEVIRSIAPRGFPRANWMGYTKDADSLLQKYWRMVTRGMDSVWWWRWEVVGRFHGWLAPDLRPYPAVKEILEDTRVVREGLGDLLLQSRMQDDGIAILYSYPSTFAHKLDEGAGFEEYEKAHAAWHKAIRDLGLQFSYVTDRMLRLGEFDGNRFRVLVLPRAEAIGDKEAQVIRAFAANGGLVIADTRPGIYDDHCKKRTASVLDDLFGVSRVGYRPAKVVFSADKKISSLIDPGIMVDANGKAAAEPDGSPTLILRKVGKGYALLINGDLNLMKVMAAEIVARFGSKASGTRPTAFADAPLGAILQGLASIEPKVTVTQEDGSAVRDVEVIRWENGKSTMVALFRQGGKGEPVTVTLPKAAYVHDLRNRKSLGLVSSFKTEILPNRASFFAVTPKPVSPIHVQLVKNGKRGEVAKVRLSASFAQGDHAVSIMARFPQRANPMAPRAGEFFPRQGYPSISGATNYDKQDLLKRVVVIGAEPIIVDLPIAYNDPAGDYEISVTELFTNITVTKKLMVK